MNQAKGGQDCEDSDPENHDRRSPKAEGIFISVIATRRAAFVVALPGNQTVARPADGAEAHQQHNRHSGAPECNRNRPCAERAQLRRIEA